MFLLGERFPLSAACYYGRPIYIDLCFRLGLDWINRQEAFLSACERGPEWVVDRLLFTQEDLVCNYEFGLWRACSGGQLNIVKKMIGLGATMIGSGLARLPLCRDQKRASAIKDYLTPFLGTRRSDGEPYF